MQYGHFDDKRLEYVVDKADTPRPWSNYLGSSEYGAIITNHAGGYSFFRSAARGRYTRLRFNSVPLDQPGRYFYLRDNASKDFWSSSWQPVGKDLKKFKYECRHGTAYTTITSEYTGIATESTYFVPLGKFFEIWMFKVTNNSKKTRDLSVFTYQEFANDWTSYVDLIDLQFSQYIVKSDVYDNIINTSYLRYLPSDIENVETPDQGRQSFFGLVGAPIAGFDTRRETFIGNYRTYGNPAVVEQGQCTGSLSHGDNACGTFQVNLKLKPGESRDLQVVLGVGSVEAHGKQIVAEYGSVKRCREELKRVREYWHSKIGALTVTTPDKEFNSMMNTWAPYNCLITYAWSRAASLVYQGERDGLGYRDTVQDILGVVPLIADTAVQRLELMITGQTSAGGAIPVIKPFKHKPGSEPLPSHYRSDDCLWLFNTVPEYVKEKGDLSFYEKVLPYADKGEATVFGHLRRALEFILANTGASGLPLAQGADWNDCIGLGATGESVFVTFQLRLGLKTYAEIAGLLGKPDERRWAVEELRVLDEKIRTICWDGAWWKRGIHGNGVVVGSHTRDEGKIFIEPQPWSIISGAATDEQAETTLASVKEHLATEFGIMICSPPYRHDRSCGAVIYNAGQKENSGIFQHTQGWVVIAEAMMGHGQQAYDYFRAYMPAAYNTRAEVRQAEPYVWCQSTHGKFSRMFGVSRLPWLSGTASWSYYSANHYILGLRPEYDGLTIDPCVPPSWKKFSMKRTFRGKNLAIAVENKKGVQKGVEKIVLNGEDIKGSFVPIAKLKDKNNVVVVMG